MIIRDGIFAFSRVATSGLRLLAGAAALAMGANASASAVHELRFNVSVLTCLAQGEADCSGFQSTSFVQSVYLPSYDAPPLFASGPVIGASFASMGEGQLTRTVSSTPLPQVAGLSGAPTQVNWMINGSAAHNASPQFTGLPGWGTIHFQDIAASSAGVGDEYEQYLSIETFDATLHFLEPVPFTPENLAAYLRSSDLDWMQTSQLTAGFFGQDIVARRQYQGKMEFLGLFEVPEPQYAIVLVMVALGLAHWTTKARASGR